MKNTQATDGSTSKSEPQSNVSNIRMTNIVLSIGDIVSDRYKILSEIAQTALSAIYVAEDTRLNRKVALKHVFKKV